MTLCHSSFDYKRADQKFVSTSMAQLPKKPSAQEKRARTLALKKQEEALAAKQLAKDVAASGKWLRA